MSTEPRIITQVKIRKTIKCKKCGSDYVDMIILDDALDTYFQLGYFVQLLNTQKIIRLQATSTYLHKLDLISDHLEKQGNSTKKWQDQVVSKKTSINFDAQIVEIKKGLTSKEIINLCKDLMLNEPRYNEAITKLIEKINNHG